MSSYTVVLTKGAHTVRASDARAICEAIEAGRRLITVGVELFPGSDAVHETTLVTAHVIALAEIEPPSDGKGNGKVSTMWERRAR